MRYGRTFDAALEDAAGSLEDADRRLAHEIAAGVLRSRSELDASLAPLVERPWRRVEDDLKDLLRIGAYQLLRLNRVPPHGAVDATVEAAKLVRGEKSAGFVNAVLRRMARELDRADRHDEPGEPATASVAALAQRHSHPEWLVARWVNRFGTARTEALLIHNNRRPYIFLQAARWTPEHLREALRGAGVAVEAAPLEAGLAVRGGSVRALPGYEEGGFIVQDPAQAQALRFADLLAGALVWDACAAPGGKAAILARRCRVVASDLGLDRLRRLADTVRRASPSVRVMAADASAPPFAAGRLDAVLVDAPCSATGTIAKHPDARWRLTPAQITRLASQQEALLSGVANVVRQGGRLVYMTCSLEREENELQVETFLEIHPAFRRECEDLFVFPPDAGTDGAFAARLVRTG